MTIKPCCAKSSLADDLDGLRIAQRTDGSNVQYAITRFTANAHLAQAKLALNCHLHITTRKGNTGLLGDLPIAKWTVGLIRKYQDHRGESSASRHVSIMPKIVIMNLCLK